MGGHPIQMELWRPKYLRDPEDKIYVAPVKFERPPARYTNIPTPFGIATEQLEQQLEEELEEKRKERRSFK